jgi:hypothetical protein
LRSPAVTAVSQFRAWTRSAVGLLRAGLERVAVVEHGQWADLRGHLEPVLVLQRREVRVLRVELVGIELHHELGLRALRKRPGLPLTGGEDRDLGLRAAPALIRTVTSFGRDRHLCGTPFTVATRGATLASAVASLATTTWNETLSPVRTFFAAFVEWAEESVCSPRGAGLATATVAMPSARTARASAFIAPGRS